MREGAEQAAVPQQAGHLFGKIGMLFILALMILSAWFEYYIVAIVLGLLLAAAVISRLWSRYSLINVLCERTISDLRLFPGEQANIRYHLVNKKILPLPWIMIEDEVPRLLLAERGTEDGGDAADGRLRKSVSLLWYSGIRWKETLRCEKRGYYRLGPVTLASGDIFGFYPRIDVCEINDYIIVYPRTYTVSHLGIPSQYPLGEIVAEKRIFEDPVRVIGIRDYTPRDSRRHIHWKATARRQSLQVKVFEPTTTLRVAVFLAVDSFLNSDGKLINDDDFELGISTAASLARYCEERRTGVGLYVNSRQADTGEPYQLLPGSSSGQLVEILEALAKVTASSTGPFEEFLQAERTGLPWGTTTIIVYSQRTEPLTSAVAGLRESGSKVITFCIGDAEGINSLDETTISIRQPEDLKTVHGGDAL